MPGKKRIDIIDQQFGTMLVLKEVDPGSNYTRMFLCRCVLCETERVYSMNLLRKGRITSCKSSACRKDRYKKSQESLDSNRVDGIMPSALIRKTRENTATGVKGVNVAYTKKGTKRYRAFISIGGKTHRLGNFDDLDAAILAREKAEAEYHQPILEKAKLQKARKEIE
ncbi:hypothetical protein ABEW34_21470 [Paenibacillus algorifonticola]|uniref:hypothetical protein n=1 Tax=Paenibacillus algorifonticola TaxID=684063 RepID=UPI003D2C6533